MIYTSEDGKTYGYKPVKFDFKMGTKTLNKETGKIAIVEGIYDLGENGLYWFKRFFSEIKNSRISVIEKVCLLKDFAFNLADDVCEITSKVRREGAEEKFSARLEEIASKLYF